MTQTMLKSKVHRATVTGCAQHSREEMEHHEPRVVQVDRENRIIAADAHVATLLA